jgi:hypothetical protein
VEGCKATGGLQNDGDGLWWPSALVRMPWMREGLSDIIRQRSLSVPALLAPGLPLPACPEILTVVLHEKIRPPIAWPNHKTAVANEQHVQLYRGNQTHEHG